MMHHHPSRQATGEGKSMRTTFGATLDERGTELLIKIIELAVKHLRVGHAEDEQTQARRLLEAEFDLADERPLIFGSGNRETSVDWWTLVKLYLDVRRSIWRPEIALDALVKRLDDWVSRLDEDHKYQLLDAIELVVLDRMAA
jgi:hypothetical protein